MTAKNKPLFHVLICGITGSGKTTAAEHLARLSPRRKVAFNPCGGFENFGAITANDPDNFLDLLYDDSLNRCDFFIDEADTIFPQYNPHNWAAQRGRHLGMRLFLITQRPVLLDTTARGQCNEAYVFRSNPKDYDAVLPIFGAAEYVRGLEIPMHEFLHMTPGKFDARLWRLDEKKRGRPRKIKPGG